jgi:hypothetical protein
MQRWYYDCSSLPSVSNPFILLSLFAKCSSDVGMARTLTVQITSLICTTRRETRSHLQGLAQPLTQFVYHRLPMKLCGTQLNSTACGQVMAQILSFLALVTAKDMVLTPIISLAGKETHSNVPWIHHVCSRHVNMEDLSSRKAWPR